MTGSSVLLVTLLFVAPCASMKMKTTESAEDDGSGGYGGWKNRDPSKKALPYPECDQDVEYTGSDTYNSKTCYIYHNYAGNGPDGAQWSLPDKYGFADGEFKLEGLSSKTLWKVNQHWPWYFTAETANGEDIEFNEGKSCGNDGDASGKLDICPNGPIWQANLMISVSKNRVKEMRAELQKAREDFEGALEHYKNIAGKDYNPEEHAEYTGYGTEPDDDYRRKEKKTKEHKK